MSKVKDLRRNPTVIENKHESLFRAYQLLQYVRVLLELGTPQEVILMIMDAVYEKDMEQLDETTWKEMQSDGESHE